MYRNNQHTKNKKMNYRIDMVVLSCAIVFIACFVIYMFRGEIVPESDNSGNPQASLQSSSDSQANQNSNQPDSKNDSSSSAESENQEKPQTAVNPVPLTSKADFTYLDNCVFVGDSLTYGLSSYQILPARNVLASIGLNISKIDTEAIPTTEGKLTAINSLKIKKPSTVYIMLGSNGIAWMNVDTMISKYSDFISEIEKELPNTKICILSIPPVTAQRETASEGAIKNSTIDEYNSQLLKMANEKKIHFVDLNTGLKNNSGKLETTKAEKDGMHFKKVSYDMMIDYILTHIPA